jgi:hypothetical protein
MTIRASIEKRIRGWYPQEPVLVIRQKQPQQKIPYMVPWLAAAIAVGLAAAASMVLLGDLLGFTVGYGAYFWYIEVGFCAWCVAGFVAVYGYLKKRREEKILE